MITYLCSIRDVAGDYFQSPFGVPSRGVASRYFGDEVMNPESPMSKHPSDYELFHVGNFNPSSGEVEWVTPERLARGTDFVPVRLASSANSAEG